eukprot:1048259-Amphidinium_carterae.1
MAMLSTHNSRPREAIGGYPAPFQRIVTTTQGAYNRAILAPRALPAMNFSCLLYTSPSPRDRG